MTPTDRAALRIRVYHSYYGCDTEETWAEWDDLDPAAIVASVKP